MKDNSISIDPQFAQRLVDIIASELKKNVNITDEQGVIIASFSRDRVSQVHEAAARILQDGKATEIAVNPQDERNLKGVRIGYSVPIVSQHKCVGVIGVTGNPNEAAPYARLAARFVEAALEANARQEQLVRALNEKRELQSVLLNKTITIQEEERKKISRELHDETSQALTSIIVGLRVLAEHIHDDSDRSRILQMRDVAVQTLEAVHNLAVNLRPVLLDDLGLVAAVQRYVDNYTRQYGIEIYASFENLNRERFSPVVEITLYRLVQEALTNIVRHARATKVTLSLFKKSGVLYLHIQDNGVGFETTCVPNGEHTVGLGIYGMRERIALLNGRFQIKSAVGKGTAITVELPAAEYEKAESML